MGGLAASGGYYVSMAVGDTENTIFAEPTCWTGSIGVIIPHYDLSGLVEGLKIEEDSIKSGPLKQMGSMLRPMTEKERAIFQQLVDDSFGRFKGIVEAGRSKFSKDPAALDGVATGQVFTTRQAIDNGLVDKEGYIEDAISRVVELAKLDKSTTKVVKYKKPFSLFEGILASSEAKRGFDTQMLLDLAAPRAWYLWSWPTLER
jgi:protease-4